MYSYITSLSTCSSQDKIVPPQLILATHSGGFASLELLALHMNM